MAERAKHAFGNSENLENALNSGVIDAYDILFLDGDTDPKVGWIDKNGDVRIVSNETDLSGIEAEIATKANVEDVTQLETKLATKVTAEEVDAKIAEAIDNVVEDYMISHKPDGTLVDYRDKEIRVMIPTGTQFKIQNSGEGADSNAYYIGMKAYAPSDDVVSFKEDLAEIISDNEMYYFEGNEFAGIDDNGKYSIVWLPVAKYDETTTTWTYYGAKSSESHYVGWYYSVEWYNADGKIVASDSIRINLSNENCHSTIEPYYVGSMMSEIETMVDKKVADATVVEVVEF